MAEYTRLADWSGLPYEARVAINGPTTAVYQHSNLPAPNDPGWVSMKNHKSGLVARLINVHGPFAILGQEDSDRCEDGWLGVDESGFIFAVDCEYVKPSRTASEMEESARPFGYKETK